MEVEVGEESKAVAAAIKSKTGHREERTDIDGIVGEQAAAARPLKQEVLLTRAASG